ncbi:MAG: hypothetical protein ACM3SV_12995 [Betaproteobacteria bacterium]
MIVFNAVPDNPGALLAGSKVTGGSFAALLNPFNGLTAVPGLSPTHICFWRPLALGAYTLRKHFGKAG